MLGAIRYRIQLIVLSLVYAHSMHFNFKTLLHISDFPIHYAHAK